MILQSKDKGFRNKETLFSIVSKIGSELGKKIDSRWDKQKRLETAQEMSKDFPSNSVRITQLELWVRMKFIFFFFLGRTK